jgi:RNA polymerase sigma-70 factor, ECF subfamily
MKTTNENTEELVALAGQGDEEAQERLLMLYRDRLRRMVAVRMDRRLSARLDPSDVVQEALVDAARKLPAYLRERPLPFYPWLRQLAWEQLVKLHERHLRAHKRSVTREELGALLLPDESVVDLSRRLVDSGTSPSQQAMRDEQSARVRAALGELSEHDREVLLLRYLEQLSIHEIAAALRTTEGAVKTHHLRALKRLRTALGDSTG